MRSISRRELTDLITREIGVVLVDHRSAGRERPSTLHSITCPWSRRVGPVTPLRFDEDASAAVRWLRRTRGDEEETWQRCPQCGGGGEAEAGQRSRMGSRALGETVWTLDRGRDLAYVSAIDGERVEVAEFDAPDREAVNRRQVTASQTDRFSPVAGQPCFVERDGEWCAAQILRTPDSDDHQVSIIAGHDVHELPLESVRFRRLAALTDPVAELAGSLVGDRPGFRARSAFSSSYAELAAVSRGLTGVASAAVDLHPHQVAVARRVLADPVQRYLLADEVGLGKTIEAGFIIRQRLIDAPRSVILVLVPSSLIWQWEEELETKFRLSEFRRGGIGVDTYEDPRALRTHQVPDLLVIDEAHRVALGRNSPSRDLAQRYEQISALAHRVPRLLLLSATPVLHRERDFLAMLHLLDPDTYDIVDPDAFTQRVRDRERIAESLLMLSPDQPAFLLQDSLPHLRAQFAGDPAITNLLDDLERELEHDDEATERVKSDLRTQVGETYRLHQRLLRNRRSVLAKSAYVVRGRCGTEIIDVADPRSQSVDRWLERWRDTLLADAIERGGDDMLDAAVGAFRVYGSYACGDPDALLDVVRYRLQLKRTLKESAGLSAEDAAALRAFERSEVQKAVTTELLDELGSDTQAAEAERLGQALLSLAPGAYVVFTTSQHTALAVGDHLAAADVTVFTCTRHGGEDDRRTAVTAFVDGIGPRFLVCDATAEEGLNLQAADAVVHLDLPWSVSRIEQRIGRLDRYGTGPAVRSVVFTSGPEDGYARWWLRALNDSFRVFDETTAPTQYAIDNVERGLLCVLLEEGIDEATAALADVEHRVADEQRRIDRIDSLDALARQETDDIAFVQTMVEREPTLADRLAADLVAALDAAAQALTPHVQPHSAGRWEVTLERETPALKNFAAIVSRPLEVTANRAAAVQTRSLSLLRPGAPLIEAVRSQLDADPQMQTCAVWAPADVEHGPQFAIRCDLRIEADASSAFAAWTALEATRPRDRSATRTDADAPLVIAALKRRVDGYLPPQLVSLWIDRDAFLIENPALASACESALESGHDLGALERDQREDIARTFGALTLQDLVAPIPGQAERAALESDAIRDLTTRALAAATRDWEARERILGLRYARDASPSSDKDLASEREVARLLRDAIHQPLARWVGAALLIRTTSPPRQG